MEGTSDDVRLPFSVMDQSMGDVFSILWEPEMMGETGNILKILTSEVLTQVGQQVLQALDGVHECIAIAPDAHQT